MAYVLGATAPHIAYPKATPQPPGRHPFRPEHAPNHVFPFHWSRVEFLGSIRATLRCKPWANFAQSIYNFTRHPSFRPRHIIAVAHSLRPGPTAGSSTRFLILTMGAQPSRIPEDAALEEELLSGLGRLRVNSIGSDYTYVDDDALEIGGGTTESLKRDSCDVATDVMISWQHELLKDPKNK